MWQEEQYKLLHQEIEKNIESLANAKEIQALAREVIDSSFKHQNNSLKNRLWPLLPLIVCEATSGDYKPALPLASILYFFQMSAELFDDIEDADSPGSLSAKAGPAVAINLATTFLMLAEKEIVLLRKKAIKSQLVLRISNTINSTYIKACNGQYLDLSPDPKKVLSEKYYLRMIGMKSASITECACHVGALLATSDNFLINKLCKFGYNLGMSSQLANDIMGITQKKDILKPKVTLPIIYVLNQVKSAPYLQFEDIFMKKCTTDYDPQKIEEILFQTGAIQYTIVKMEYYKTTARDILFEVKNSLEDSNKLLTFTE